MTDPVETTQVAAISDVPPDAMRRAQDTVASVILERRRLAEQYAQLDLLKDTVRKNHHPLIQALLQARDDWADCEKGSRERTAAQRNINDVMRIIQKDIGEGASEMNKLLISVHQAAVAKETRIAHLKALERKGVQNPDGLSTAEMLRVKEMLATEDAGHAPP